ncbi:hypothetical protein [Deferrisoma camini]|uniref:hypothetical protein n=1 Tax=Deferrisoma camini TaxID=1035120 RepID=UPI00046CEFD2|nr:hypothetical protein [Deferrisoma camini]
MPLSTMAAHDMERTLFGPDFAETSDYDHPDLASTPVRVRAVWGAVEVAEVGAGFVADACEVLVPEADLQDVAGSVNPKRRAMLTRYPDDVSAAETWEVESIRREAGMWRLRVERNVRPLARR